MDVYVSLNGDILGAARTARLLRFEIEHNRIGQCYEQKRPQHRGDDYSFEFWSRNTQPVFDQQKTAKKPYPSKEKNGMSDRQAHDTCELIGSGNATNQSHNKNKKAADNLW